MANDPRAAKDSSELIKEAAPAIADRKRGMRAGEVDEEKANHWLAEHWPEERRSCPVCGENNWAFVPQFIFMSLGPLGLHTAPRALPCVGLTCRTCAHTIFFNAIIMGQLPAGEE